MCSSRAPAPRPAPFGVAPWPCAASLPCRFGFWALALSFRPIASKLAFQFGAERFLANGTFTATCSGILRACLLSQCVWPCDWISQQLKNMVRLRTDDPADRPKHSNPQQSSRSRRWIDGSGKKNDKLLLRSAEKIHERETERGEAKEAAAVKQWAKNTETAKEDGGTHFERVFINEAGWKALDRQISEFLEEGNAFMPLLQPLARIYFCFCRSHPRHQAIFY